MFTYDKDIFVPKANIWLDSARKKEFGFISHAHGDHIVRNEQSICSAPTADILKIRLKNPSLKTLDYGVSYNFNNTEITLYPAGHILGSAQIKIVRDGKSLLYSGDFRLKKSQTAEQFQQVTADIVIMETTFGKKKYVMPPREECAQELITLCREKLEDGITPIVFAYSLGKGQEALKILGDAGLPVAIDYSIGQFVPIYQKWGIKLPLFSKFKKSEYQDKVLLLPAGMRFQRFFKNLPDKYSIFLSGWGMDESAVFRYKVDRVIPISDHADYNELLEFADKVEATEIYCTHGFKDFVSVLREKGHNAYLLEASTQLSIV